MVGTLEARIERLEQSELPAAAVGFYWVMPVSDDEQLPKSYSMGGPHSIFAARKK
jgi:hypothetical protein